MQTEFHITNMSCAGCVARAERALRAVPGVISAEVNFASHTAQIIHHNLPLSTLTEAVAAAGYPADLSGQDSGGDEVARLKRQALIAVLLVLPVFLVEMGGHLYPPLHHWVHHTIGAQAARLLQFLLVGAALAGPGRRFFTKGLPALWRGAPDMNALVALGAGAAFLYSSVTTFAPALLPHAARHVYFEAAGVIVALILIGRYLEARAHGQTGAAIAKLMALRPETALVEREGAVHERPIGEIIVGDILHLRPGERVACDGRVVSGESAVDEAMLSGEAMPVEKAPGDALVGGSVNGAGALRYEAEHVGRDTNLARIIDMVRQAQGAKLPIQALLDRVTLWFVPGVIGLSLLTFALWLGFGPGLSEALVAAVSVLIIACPCAMGLATPVSIMVGTGRAAADLGILLRRGDALQSLRGAQVVAFDKTGTLTLGRPVLSEVIAVEGHERAELLALAGALEAGSEHPIAHAIREGAAELYQPPVSGFRALPGFGAEAEVAGQRALIGAARLMAREGVALGDLAARAEDLEARGESVVFVALDGAALGLLSVADQLKPSAAPALRRLKEMGLRTVMLTGDRKATAEAMAQDLALDEIRAELLPEDKLAAIKGLSQIGPVVFVGDGINDAPALAAADIGIAIGSGTDIAVEAGDVVLISGDLGAVEQALCLSRAVMRNIAQNLAWAFGYNIVLIPVAAFGGLSPMLAAGAMALSSVFVVTNALRLRRVAL